MDIVEELRNDRENDILVCLVAKSGARAPTAEAVFRSWGLPRLAARCGEAETDAAVDAFMADANTSRTRQCR